MSVTELKRFIKGKERWVLAVAAVIIILTVIVLAYLFGAFVGKTEHNNVERLLNQGRVWYLLKDHNSIKDESPVKAVLFFGKDKVVTYDISEWGGSHILADFVGRNNGDVFESLEEERRERADEIIEILNEKLDDLDSLEKLNKSENSDEVLDLTQISDIPTLWDLSAALIYDETFEQEFRTFLEDYFTGNLQNPITKRIVVQHNRDGMDERIQKNRQLYSEIKGYLENKRPEGSYSVAIRNENNALLNWRANGVIQVNPSSEAAMPTVTWTADTADESAKKLTKYLTDNRGSFELVSYNAEEIVLKEKAYDYEDEIQRYTIKEPEMSVNLTGVLPSDDDNTVRGQHFDAFITDGGLLVTASGDDKPMNLAISE